MMADMQDKKRNSNEGFTPPGLLRVSREALQVARDFCAAARSGQPGDWIAVFDWLDSVSLKRGPDQPYEDIGACLALGAYGLHELPPEFVQEQDGVAFAVSIPEDIRMASARRLIDIDETKPFGLVLR